ncbi:sensor histidine kinase [Winogradskya consettensis]|uniref:histidine kinase n=1 Tax=Winogradskya consettensis TaxID=113560 RepID=A0A919W004_9ACTN|nr:sensor histidine kinase [Actinoplanes consettensis]GIM80890.1 histidine kinase [Actinoplanes consettensis]
MAARNALEALTMRPTRFLVSSWPWRSLAYLTGGALFGFATIFVVAGLLVTGVALSIVLIGLAAYLATLLAGVVVGRLERWRMRLIDRDVLPDPHRRPPRPGLRAWLLFRLREQSTWRELGYTIVSAAALCWMDAAVVTVTIFVPTAFLFAPLYIDDRPLSVTLPMTLVAPLAFVIAAYPVTAWAGARAAMARAILAPRSNDTDAKLVEVTRSRARLVDAFEVERRRIERDLHDGAQQRLVALSMQLGMARLEVPRGSPADTALTGAQALAREALAELRELIRGVHPKVLTDRGLAAAVTDAAGHAPVPVDLDLRLDARLPATIEVAAYFVVVEALANLAKHSAATRASVAAAVHGDRLHVDVRDNGRGGADPSRGTGLIGLADRVAAVDGTVALSSPPGGPTLVHVEIPCGS